MIFYHHKQNPSNLARKGNFFNHKKHCNFVHMRMIAMFGFLFFSCQFKISDGSWIVLADSALLYFPPRAVKVKGAKLVKKIKLCISQ